jgi:hypothetical protein
MKHEVKTLILAADLSLSGLANATTLVTDFQGNPVSICAKNLPRRWHATGFHWFSKHFI